jgi:hypothetical protein
MAKRGRNLSRIRLGHPTRNERTRQRADEKHLPAGAAGDGGAHRRLPSVELQDTVAAFVPSPRHQDGAGRVGGKGKLADLGGIGIEA